MESDLQEQIEDVQTAPNSLEKARAEMRLTKAMPKMAWSEKRKLACQMTGERPNHMDSRKRLLLASPVSDHLWAEIDAGRMTTSSAVEEVQRLEKAAGAQSSEPSSPAEPETKPPPEAPEAHPSPEKKAPAKRRHRAALRGFVAPQIGKLLGRTEALLRKRNPSLSDADVRRLMKQFAEDIRTAAGTMSVRADRMEREAAETAAIETDIKSRKVSDMLSRSCDLLKVERPRTGLPVDIAAARRNMRRIAGSLHPDRNPGNVDLYREVVEAFADLERYNEGLRP